MRRCAPSCTSTDVDHGRCGGSSIRMRRVPGLTSLIVTGVSTSHCVYATCRDATDSFRVIVPREAVGERCEIFHEVNLLDIELDLGDVLPVDEVIGYLAGLPPRPRRAS